MYISSCPWGNAVANSLTETYSSPCLLLTYRSPYVENCRQKQFTDAVHTVVSMMTICGKPTHGNVQIVFCPWWKLVANQIALSTFDEDCLRTYSRLLYIRVYDGNWYVAHQLIHEMKIGVGSADSRKWKDRRSEAVRREKKPLSLLCASQLVVSDVAAWWLARSFAKKNFKKNIWDQDSGEPFRRWFKIHRTGSPYRWTRS